MGKKDGHTVPKKPTSCKGIGVCSEKNPKHRRKMEDEHVMFDTFGGEKGLGYFGVYDGHGGRQTVEFVAEHLHDRFLKILKSEGYKDMDKNWLDAYTKVDEEIGEAKIMNSGCTSVTLLLKNKGEGSYEFWTANAGDARIVLVDDGKAERLTYEHKGADKPEQERVTAGGGFMIGGRVNGILAVTRSLGDYALKQVVIGDPYCQHREVGPSASHIILACDGLWDVCTDQEAADIILKEKDAQKMSNKLVAHAMKNGSTDNISVMVLKLQ